MRTTKSKMNNVAPIVEFSGRKLNYYKDMSLRFGVYCEILIPNHRVKATEAQPGTQATFNNALVSRSHPAIALYPVGNSYGSWVFWDLTTNAYVSRSNWKIMMFSDIVKQRIDTISKIITPATIEEVIDDTAEIQVDNITELVQVDVQTNEEEVLADIVPEEIMGVCFIASNN